MEQAGGRMKAIAIAQTFPVKDIATPGLLTNNAPIKELKQSEKVIVKYLGNEIS